MNILGLLSAQPQPFPAPDDPRPTELRIDVASALDEPATPALLCPILNEANARELEIANRVIAPGTKAKTVRGTLLNTDLGQRFLAGHCLDAECVDLLRSEQQDAFLRRRAGIVRETIYNHVQGRALFGFRDGPDLSGLFDDVEGEPS